jgi:hypothetical protein
LVHLGLRHAILDAFGIHERNGLDNAGYFQRFSHQPRQALGAFDGTHVIGQNSFLRTPELAKSDRTTWRCRFKQSAQKLALLTDCGRTRSGLMVGQAETGLTLRHIVWGLANVPGTPIWGICNPKLQP